MYGQKIKKNSRRERREIVRYTRLFARCSLVDSLLREQYNFIGKSAHSLASKGKDDHHFCSGFTNESVFTLHLVFLFIFFISGNLEPTTLPQRTK